MATASKKYRQRTVDFPEHGKVKIVTRPKTHVGNLVGYYVNFNDIRYTVHLGAVLQECANQGHADFEQAAEDIAFVKWVRQVA